MARGRSMFVPRWKRRKRRFHPGLEVLAVRPVPDRLSPPSFPISNLLVHSRVKSNVVTIILVGTRIVVVTTLCLYVCTPLQTPARFYKEKIKKANQLKI